ncbi:MAG: hypothetical protein ACT6FG_01830 [Methanosarcinaceae archaeon]
MFSNRCGCLNDLEKNGAANARRLDQPRNIIHIKKPTAAVFVFAQSCG